MTKHLLSAAMLAALLPVTAFAATETFTPTADGDVQTFGGDDVDTADTVLSFTQSGGLIRNAILEFDLSSIPDTASIISASLTFTLNRFVSGSNAQVDVFAFNGDGVVNIADYDAVGTQVVDAATASGGSQGDTRSFAFSLVAPITAALVGDDLTLRLETDSFVSFQIVSSEGATASLDAPTLSVEFSNPAPVPLPAGLPLLLAGMGAFAWMKRRAA